jgi:peptidase E
VPRDPQILATSGGFTPRAGVRNSADRGGLINEAIRLAEVARAKVCGLFGAVGDNPGWIAWWYDAMGGHDDVTATHLALYDMPNRVDVRAHLLAQDVIWVSGGSTANLLAVWRAHGVDEVLTECWESGVVLTGVSAGSLCWHVGGTTDSFGLTLQPLLDGLGLLPYSNCPHYDAEDQRRPLYHRLISEGTLPAGYATDNGAGLHYVSSELVRVVAEVEGAAAYRVEPSDDGVAETRLEAAQVR